MEAATGMTIGAIARLAGVTVRTLHHYDEIGLVTPGDRTAAGYRLYGRADIARLQEILFFRELGFGLDEIKQMVGEPRYARTQALRRQRALLDAKVTHLFNMMDAIDKAIEAEGTDMNLTPQEMLEVFGDFDPAAHEAEAEERWGTTEAYEQSQRNVSRYTKQDWQALQQEADAINQDFLALMAAGVAPDSAQAMDLAEAHRAHISKWFYDCTPEIHAGLGQMYVADPRFTKNIDKAGEGLARYLSEAIAASHAGS